MIREPEVVARLRADAVERIRTDYGWDAVTDAYETLFERAIADGVP